MDDLFRERVERRIAELGYSQAQASREANRSATFVRDILKRSSNPSFENVAALAGALKVSPFWLLGVGNEDGTSALPARPVAFSVATGGRMAEVSKTEAVPVGLMAGVPDDAVIAQIRTGPRSGKIIVAFPRCAPGEVLGEEAVIGLEGGAMMLGEIERDGDETFVLAPEGAPKLRALRVEWAAPVEHTLRRADWREDQRV